MNDVIRSITTTLEDYGCEEILGIKYGFRGFFGDEAADANPLEAPIKLTSEVVEDIQITGGSILGSSRGGADMPAIVQKIEDMGIDFLFVIGGNGSHAGGVSHR